MRRPAATAVASRDDEAARTTRLAFAALTLATVLAAGMALGGCNTVSGAGQDIDAAGKAVTNSAEKTKQQL